MTEEYFKSEDFYKLCLRACNFQFSKYYKPYFKEKEDMISNAILSIFEHKKELENLEENELFIKLSKIAKASFEKDRTKKLKEIYNTSFSLDEEMCEGKTYGEIFSVECDKHLEEREGFEILKCLFKDFIKTFDKAEREIAINYIKGMNFNQIKARHHTRAQDIVSIVRNFRFGFARFLKDREYFKSLNVLKADDEFGKRLNEAQIKMQKKKGLDVDYGLYKRDCLVYKLIRDNNLIEEVSQCLNKSPVDLQDILFHKRKNVKLLLFEIQKLRDEFFNSYSLTELVNA